MRLCPRLTERHPTASAVACGRKLPAEASARDLLETGCRSVRKRKYKISGCPQTKHIHKQLAQKH